MGSSILSEVDSTSILSAGLSSAITILSIRYRPLGSCSRAAGWSAATLCRGPTRPNAPPHDLGRLYEAPRVKNRVPYQGPSFIVARAQGSKEDGTHLTGGVLQPCDQPITHPPWKRYILFVFFAAILFALENCAFRYDTGLEIAPKRDQ